jgi:DNA-directed RNA polymerase subunit RPC12/RpoP
MMSVVTHVPLKEGAEREWDTFQLGRYQDRDVPVWLTVMAITPEPGMTKCPTCASAMVPVGVTKEEGQTVRYLDCPECGHQLKEPAGASSSPSGW